MDWDDNIVRNGIDYRIPDLRSVREDKRMTISDKELEGIGKAIWESFGFREMTDEERMFSDAAVKQYLQEKRDND